MNMKYRAVLSVGALAVAMALSACNQSSSSSATSDTSSTASAVQAPAPSAPPPQNALPASQAVPTSQGPQTQAADTTSVKEGVNYTRVNVPGFVMPADGKMDVREYFWFGCPHCFKSNPGMQAWSQGAKNTTFEYEPVAFTAQWEVAARLNYALQAQHLTEDDRQKVFNAIHLQGVNPTNKQALIAWAGSNGWNADQLNQAWDSFAVSTNILRDRKEAETLNLDAVPAVVINGKYMVTVEQSGGDADLSKGGKRVLDAIQDGRLAP